MPFAIEPLAVEQLKYNEDLRDVGVSRAPLMVRDSLGTRLSAHNLADLVKVALKVCQRWVVDLLTAIEPFGNLGHHGLINALEQMQPDMSAREACPRYIVGTLNGILNCGVGVPAIDDPMTARIGKCDPQLACPALSAGKFGVLHQ